MRVLLVAKHFAPAWIEGGVTISNWNLARGLALAGARVHVVTTTAYLERRDQVPPRRDEEGVFIETVPVLSSLGGTAHRYGLAPGLLARVWQAAHGVDLCLMQGLWALPVPLAAGICRLRRVPYVLCAQGGLEEISLSEKAFKKRLFMRFYGAGVIRRAAAVYFASEREHRNSRAALGATAALVFPHGFDFEAPRSREGARLRNELGLPRDSIVLGLAGRLHPRKGFSVILQALAECSEQVHLVAFGPDQEDYLKEIRKLAATLSIGRRFHYMGYLEGEALQSAYASIDLLVLPSFGESFGNVVIESLRQGTEVMVSDAVALAGRVEQDGVGRVVRGHDVRAWSEAIDRWVDERDRFDRSRAVLWVGETFGLEDCGRRLLEALAALPASTR